MFTPKGVTYTFLSVGCIKYEPCHEKKLSGGLRPEEPA